MWEGWNKYVDTEEVKRYELLVESSRVKVRLGVYLTKGESIPSTWEVLINAFNPGAGEYILYEDAFADFAQAEGKAWQKAQEVLASYKRRGWS